MTQQELPKFKHVRKTIIFAANTWVVLRENTWTSAISDEHNFFFQVFHTKWTPTQFIDDFCKVTNRTAIYLSYVQCIFAYTFCVSATSALLSNNATLAVDFGITFDDNFSIMKCKLTNLFVMINLNDEMVYLAHKSTMLLHLKHDFLGLWWYLKSNINGSRNKLMDVTRHSLWYSGESIMGPIRVVETQPWMQEEETFKRLPPYPHVRNGTVVLSMPYRTIVIYLATLKRSIADTVINGKNQVATVQYIASRYMRAYAYLHANGYTSASNKFFAVYAKNTFCLLGIENVNTIEQDRMHLVSMLNPLTAALQSERQVQSLFSNLLSLLEKTTEPIAAHTLHPFFKRRPDTKTLEVRTKTVLQRASFLDPRWNEMGEDKENIQQANNVQSPIA